MARTISTTVLTRLLPTKEDDMSDVPFSGARGLTTGSASAVLATAVDSRS